MRLIDADELLKQFEEADCDVRESFADEFCEFGFSMPVVRQIIENATTIYGGINNETN